MYADYTFRRVCNVCALVRARVDTSETRGRARNARSAREAATGVAFREKLRMPETTSLTASFPSSVLRLWRTLAHCRAKGATRVCSPVTSGLIFGHGGKLSSVPAVSVAFPLRTFVQILLPSFLPLASRLCRLLSSSVKTDFNL